MAAGFQAATGLPVGTRADEAMRSIQSTIGEIGKLAVASQGLFGAMRAGIAAVQNQIASFVQLANPAAVQRFKLAVDDLYGVIGRAMVPVLNIFTAMIQKLADYFYALSPAAKTLIAGLTAAAIGFTAVTVAVWAMNAALGAMTGGLTTLIGAISSFVVGIVVASSGTDKLKGAFDVLAGPLEKIVNTFGDIAAVLTDALMPIASIALKAFALNLEFISSALKLATPFFNAFAAILKVLEAVVDSVMGTFFAIMQSFQPIMDVVIGVLTRQIQVFADTLLKIVPYIQKFAAYMQAAIEIAAEALGLPGGANKVPGKAPPAVRQAQIGDLGSFISRQYVNALQGGSPEQKQVSILTNMAVDVKAIKDELKAYISVAGQVKNATVGTASAVGGAVLPGLTVSREVLRWVTGK